jgi:hypothetical protein
MKTNLTFSLKGITACVYLDKRVKTKLDYPVKYRITYQRKHFYLLTGLRLTEKQWSILLKSTKKDLKESREILFVGFDRIKQIIRNMFLNNETFSFESLKNYYSPSSISLEDLFILKMKNTISIDKASYINKTLDLLNEFSSNKSILLKDITIPFLASFNDFLLQNKSLSTKDTKTHINYLKSILRFARIQDLISQKEYPFGKGKFIFNNKKNRIPTKPTKTFIEKNENEENLPLFPFSPHQPEELYRKSFEKYFSCKPNDYLIKKHFKGSKDTPYLFKYMGRFYMVSSERNIEAYIIEGLSFPEAAYSLLPTPIINEVGEDIMSRSEFVNMLLHDVTKEEKRDLIQALTLFNATGDSYLFWNTLVESEESLSCDLYGKAVIAMSKIFDFNSVVNEIFEIFTTNGSEYLNQIQHGIFESIFPNESNNEEVSEYDKILNPCFYLYSVDDVLWEVD